MVIYHDLNLLIYFIISGSILIELCDNTLFSPKFARPSQVQERVRHQVVLQENIFIDIILVS